MQRIPKVGCYRKDFYTSSFFQQDNSDHAELYPQKLNLKGRKMETKLCALNILPKRRTLMFCASRHSIISIAFFRQRLNGRDEKK